MVRFALAPMNSLIRVLTWVCFFVPGGLAYAALSAPPPVQGVLVGAIAFTLLTYASVWFVFRPSAFEIDAVGLRMKWPVRERLIPAEAIAEARCVSGDEFRREYGQGIRIGAGGLWGGFGLLKTRRETFSMWISRTDDYVIVRVQGDRPLLLTPGDPARFVGAVGKIAAGTPQAQGNGA